MSLVYPKVVVHRSTEDQKAQGTFQDESRERYHDEEDRQFDSEEDENDDDGDDDDDELYQGYDYDSDDEEDLPFSIEFIMRLLNNLPENRIDIKLEILGNGDVPWYLTQEALMLHVYEKKTLYLDQYREETEQLEELRRKGYKEDEKFMLKILNQRRAHHLALAMAYVSLGNGKVDGDKLLLDGVKLYRLVEKLCLQLGGDDEMALAVDALMLQDAINFIVMVDTIPYPKGPVPYFKLRRMPPLTLMKVKAFYKKGMVKPREHFEKHYLTKSDRLFGWLPCAVTKNDLVEVHVMLGVGNPKCPVPKSAFSGWQTSRRRVGVHPQVRLVDECVQQLRKLNTPMEQKLLEKVVYNQTAGWRATNPKYNVLRFN